MRIAGIGSFFRLRNDSLGLYENGLVLTHKGKVHVAKWDEIEGLCESAVKFIVNGLASRVNYDFTVKKFDGEIFTVGSTLQDIEEIGKRLTDEVYKRRMPVIIREFNRGETVNFGRFSINQSYLISEKRGQLPLSDIKSIDVYEGTICINKKDKILVWDTAKYGSIPNARILLAIWDGIK